MLWSLWYMYDLCQKYPKGPFKCYVTLFFWKLDPHPPPRNANNIEHYTFVTLFSRKSDTPSHPHLRYVTLEWPLTYSLTVNLLLIKFNVAVHVLPVFWNIYSDMPIIHVFWVDYPFLVFLSVLAISAGKFFISKLHPESIKLWLYVTFHPSISYFFIIFLWIITLLHDSWINPANI